MNAAGVPAELSARLFAQVGRGVRRVSVDVLGEQVTFSLREGGVQVLCTCGGELCEHVSTALGMFEPAAPLPAREPKQRASASPPAGRNPQAAPLASALDELCLATARAGVSAHESPSIRAALEQLSHAADPPSLALARFIGRFQSALTMGEVGKLARLLAGAARFVAEVRAGEASPEAKARVRAWVGVQEGDPPASLTDAFLVEVGREWLAGFTRSAIERRYLIDLASGELYCEERRRGESDVSVGPCPRVVHVAFAELETALSPPRARLLQYTVTSDPSPAQWQRLAELGEKRVATLISHYANAVRRCPGLAEPTLLLAPSALSPAPLDALRDETGTRLSLRDDGDGKQAEALRSVVADDEIVWVLGRLRGLASGFSLRPVSVLVRSGGGLALRRIT